LTIAPVREIVVEEVSLEDIKFRFRLRTPKHEKVVELAESIKNIGLLNPITLDNNNYLVCGYHRFSAYKLLGYTHIPVIHKDYSLVLAELAEIDENLKISSLSKISSAEHIVRREELYEKLGLRTKSGFNEEREGLISTTQLAEEIGITNRAYRLKRQPAKIVDDVKDELRDSKFADVLMDMVKLSQQEPEVQRKISRLLISGKCRTFKRAFVEGNMVEFRKTKEYKVDFNIKERYGKIPHSIMRFQRGNNQLQTICDAVAHDEELQWTKRDGLHFGETNIPVYQMAANHAEFLITYYTPENGIILDSFMGRATIGMASLLHDRKFVGFDTNKKNVDKTRSVMSEHFDTDNFDLYNSDGILLEEFDDKSEYFDAICEDPPYILKNERYNKDDERDLSNLSKEDYMIRMKEHFIRLARLIKTSNFDKKQFHPVICKVGTGRRGKEGIVDMDIEFQLAAKEAGFVLWDKVFNELHSPWGSVNWERNYLNKYTQKNYETNLVFCKF